MPIYEYRCQACGAEFERFQKITDESRPTCEVCGAEQTERLVSMSSFHLKGSGWYVTDYKGKNAGNKAAKDSGAETHSASDASSGGAGTASTKPAASASSD